MSNILVTGGAGFIGSWLVPRLIDLGHNVRVLDNLSPQIHGAVPRSSVSWLCRGGASFERGDIRDHELLERLLRNVDAVVHLAAETGTGQSMYQIGHYYDVNVQATAKLFELVTTRCKTVKHVVLASSRSVYGEGAYRLDGQLLVPPSRSLEKLTAGQWEPVGPQGEALELVATPEEVIPSPASVYASSKLANEHLGRIVSEAYGLTVTALRFQNVYGEGQSLRNPYTGILSIFSNRMRQGLPINVFEDGKESRDFVHVSDVVRAIELTLGPERSGFEVFNVGSGEPASVLRVAELLRSLLGSDSPIGITGQFRVGDIRHCYADLRRAREHLGFEPMVPIRDGLAAFVGWVSTQDIVEDRSIHAQQELGRMGLGRAT